MVLVHDCSQAEKVISGSFLMLGFFACGLMPSDVRYPDRFLKGIWGLKAGSQYDTGASVTTLAPAQRPSIKLWTYNAVMLGRSQNDARIELIFIPASWRLGGPASDQSECRIVVNHALPTLLRLLQSDRCSTLRCCIVNCITLELALLDAALERYAGTSVVL